MIIDTGYELKLRNASFELTEHAIRLVLFKCHVDEKGGNATVAEIHEILTIRMEINRQEEWLVYEMLKNRC